VRGTLPSVNRGAVELLLESGGKLEQYLFCSEREMGRESRAPFKSTREHRSFERASPFEAQGKQDRREIPPLRKPTIR
jgi:hypothetical protein